VRPPPHKSATPLQTPGPRPGVLYVILIFLYTSNMPESIGNKLISPAEKFDGHEFQESLRENLDTLAAAVVDAERAVDSVPSTSSEPLPHTVSLQIIKLQRENRQALDLAAEAIGRLPEEARERRLLLGRIITKIRDVRGVAAELRTEIEKILTRS